MRIVKSWKFVVIITILTLFGLYVGTLYTQDITLPSENWSNEIQIQTIIPENNERNVEESVFTLPIPEDDLFITFWYKNFKITYSVYSNEGELISNDFIDQKINTVYKLQAILRNDNIILYTLEKDQLYSRIFDLKNNTLSGEIKVSDEIEDFTIHGNLLVCKGTNTFEILNDNNDVVFSKNAKTSDFAIDEYEGTHYLTFVEQVGMGGQELNYLTLDSFQEATNTTLRKLIFDINGKIAIAIVNKEVNIVIPTYDSKNMRIVGHVYSFPIDNHETITHKLFREYGSADSLTVVDFGSDKLQFIMSATIMKGSKNFPQNLMLFTYDNGDFTSKKLLSKTNTGSAYPIHFRIGDNDYVQWVDKRMKDMTINFASNNENIITLSKNYTMDEWGALLSNTLISIMAIAFSGLQPLLITLGPTGLIMIIWSSRKIYWVEQNSLKAFIPSVIIHNIFKIIFLFLVVFNNQEIIFSLPSHFKNPWILGLTLFAVTLIAIYSALNFHKKHDNFFATYIFYAITDIVFLSLVIYPYFASYRIFDYMTLWK